MEKKPQPPIRRNTTPIFKFQEPKKPLKKQIFSEITDQKPGSWASEKDDEIIDKVEKEYKS